MRAVQCDGMDYGVRVREGWCLCCVGGWTVALLYDAMRAGSCLQGCRAAGDESGEVFVSVVSTSGRAIARAQADAMCRILMMMLSGEGEGMIDRCAGLKR
jgi:hypothetical protein